MDLLRDEMLELCRRRAMFFETGWRGKILLVCFHGVSPEFIRRACCADRSVSTSEDQACLPKRERTARRLGVVYRHSIVEEYQAVVEGGGIPVQDEMRDERCVM